MNRTLIPNVNCDVARLPAMFAQQDIPWLPFVRNRIKQFCDALLEQLAVEPWPIVGHLRVKAIGFRSAELSSNPPEQPLAVSPDAFLGCLPDNRRSDPCPRLIGYAVPKPHEPGIAGINALRPGTSG